MSLNTTGLHQPLEESKMSIGTPMHDESMGDAMPERSMDALSKPVTLKKKQRTSKQRAYE